MSQRGPSGYFNVTSSVNAEIDKVPANITNVFIVWSLTSAGETNLNNEIIALKAIADYQIANNSQDAYFLGLLASSLYNMKRAAEALVYAD
jgi:hypothetical protein